MNREDIRTLKILEEIDRNEAPSQRDMARKLDISLGLVNSFVKRLTQKGYFKVTNIPRNRVKYILTPKGAAEKMRLTYEYIKYSFAFYKTSRQKLRELFQNLAKQEVARIVFYGISDLAEIAYISLQEFPIELVAVIDDMKNGESFFGYIVIDPSRVETISYDRVLITAIMPPDEFTTGQRKIALPAEKIVTL